MMSLAAFTPHRSQGVQVLVDGSTFAGRYTDDKRNGPGVETNHQGGSFAGDWADDKYVQHALASYIAPVSPLDALYSRGLACVLRVSAVGELAHVGRWTGIARLARHGLHLTA